MINLYPLHPTSSFTVFPDVTSSYESSSYELQLVQDYDRSSYTLDITRVNTPNRLSEMLVFYALSGSSGYPTYDGQYTATTKLVTDEQQKWGTFASLFSEADVTFGNAVSRTSEINLSVDRAYVHGTNLQTITTNTSTDQNGTYTTYNG